MDLLKRFRMMNCEQEHISIAIGTNLNKVDIGSNLYPTFFKGLVGSLCILLPLEQTLCMLFA